jgi:hypothetical protein
MSDFDGIVFTKEDVSNLTQQTTTLPVFPVAPVTIILDLIMIVSF